MNSILDWTFTILGAIFIMHFISDNAGWDDYMSSVLIGAIIKLLTTSYPAPIWLFIILGSVLGILLGFVDFSDRRKKISYIGVTVCSVIFQLLLLLYGYINR